jgi:hypothetical protein
MAYVYLSTQLVSSNNTISTFKAFHLGSNVFFPYFVGDFKPTKILNILTWSILSNI